MLLEATAQDFSDLIAGRAPRDLNLPDSPLADGDVLQMISDLFHTLAVDFTPAAWLVVEHGEVAGLCLIKGLPDDGAIDIAYGIAPTRWNRGIVSRAVADVIAWARADGRVTCLTAETLPDGWASQRVLERNGFVRTGERIDDEDGLVIGWRCETGAHRV